MFLVAALVAGLLGVAPAADVAVDLEARPTLLIPAAYYDVTVTNNGPDALTSATVVVRFARKTLPASSSPCVHDTTAGTLTCTFGPLAAGATATKTTYIHFFLSSTPGPVDATATRTASAPADPDPVNDADAENCWYRGGSVFPPLVC
jgi:hypothetical protein